MSKWNGAWQVEVTAMEGERRKRSKGMFWFDSLAGRLGLESRCDEATSHVLSGMRSST